MALDGLAVSIGSRTADVKGGIESVKASLGGLGREAVNTNADLGVAEAGLDDARDSAIGLTATLQALRGRADEAGDELRSTGFSAAGASGGMSTFTLSTEGAAFATSNLSGVLMLSLIPALVTLAGALVPIVTALGGFVSIGAAIAGVGLVGALGAIATNTEELKSGFQDLLASAKEEFAPFFDLMSGALLALMDDFEDAMGAIAGPFTDRANQLAGAFLDLGQAVIDSLPAFADLAVTLTEEFLPPLTMLAEDVLPEVPGFIETLVDVARRLGPTFSEVGDFLFRFGPALLDFGFAALNVVAPALDWLGDVTLTLLRHFNSLEGGLRDIMTGASLLAPVVIGLVSLLGGPATLAIAGLAAAAVGLWKAWESNFGNIRGVVKEWVDELKSLLPAARSAWESFMSGIDMEAIQKSVSQLNDDLNEFLTKNLEAMKPVLSDVKTLLKDNSEEFETMGNAVTYLIEAGIGLAQTYLKVVGPVFRKVIIPLIRGFIDVLDVMLTKLSQSIKLLGALEEGNGVEALSQMQDLGLADTPSGAITQSQEAQAEQTRETVVERIGKITVEDGEIVGKMDERADKRIGESVDRSQRGAGG